MARHPASNRPPQGALCQHPVSATRHAHMTNTALKQSQRPNACAKLGALSATLTGACTSAGVSYRCVAHADDHVLFRVQEAYEGLVGLESDACVS
jgi:hypothetical protein